MSLGTGTHALPAQHPGHEAGLHASPPVSPTEPESTLPLPDPVTPIPPLLPLPLFPPLLLPLPLDE